MSTIRILIADDHAIVRDGMQAFFQFLPDIEVVGSASDGQEAVEKTAALRPDVLILDLNMPKMNGWEFMEAFNQFNLKTTTPRVYILTTSMNPEDRLKAENTAFVSGFYKKPFSESMLDQIVAEFEHEE